MMKDIDVLLKAMETGRMSPILAGRLVRFC